MKRGPKPMPEEELRILVAVYMCRELRDQVTAQAESEGLSRSVWIRRAILRGLGKL